MAQVGGESFSPWMHIFPTHLRMDSLGFGDLLSYFWHFHHEPLRRIWSPFRVPLLLAGFLLLLPAFWWPQPKPAIWTVGLTGFYLGGGAILLSLLLGEIPANVLTRGLGAIGGQSYSVDLWHGPVVAWVMPRFRAELDAIHSLAAPATGMATSIVLGLCMAWVVEAPVLRLREQWLPSRDRCIEEGQAQNCEPTRVIAVMETTDCNVGIGLPLSLDDCHTSAATESYGPVVDA